MKAKKPPPGRVWTDLAWAAGSVGLLNYWAWYIFSQPALSAALTIPFPLKVLAAAGVAATAAGLFGVRQRRQTYEDLAGGIWVTGYPGCGKTYLVYSLLPDWVARGFGGVWASPKGAGGEVLGRFPKSAADRVDLIQPYGPAPRGLNLMHTYTHTPEERELLAGLVADWFLREHRAAGQNMAHLVFMGSLGLLEWAEKVGEQVTPVELYRLFQRPDFRRQVLAVANPLVADAFDCIAADTLDRVQRLVARTIASDTLMVTIGQRDSIDVLAAMQQNRWVVLDAPLSQVPHSIFLCRTLASLVQLLTPQRKTLNQGCKPFVAVFDEIQEYPTPVFARGLAMAREYGVVWTLVHHSRTGQLLGHDNPLRAAVGMAANKYWFRQTPEDATDASKACAGVWEPESFIHLAKRHYKALLRVAGGHVQMVTGHTRRVGPPDPELATEIRRRNQNRLTRAEVLNDVHRRLKGGHVGW